jgi:hypothetical protein
MAKPRLRMHLAYGAGRRELRLEGLNRIYVSGTQGTRRASSCNEPRTVERGSACRMNHARHLRRS